MSFRPKPGEDEEDLLKFQQEFLASQSERSSVAIKRPEKRRSNDQLESRDIVQMEGDHFSEGNTNPKAPVPKMSKFKAQQDKMKVNQATTTQEAFPSSSATPMDDADIEDMMDRKDTGFAAVLTTIIERDTKQDVCFAPKLAKAGFPKVLSMGGQHEKSPVSSAKTRKKSLFAQQVEKQGVQTFGVHPDRFLRLKKPASLLSSQGESVSQAQASGSVIVSGKGLNISDSEREAHTIHQENVGKLAQMSEKDILEEQKKLKDMTDPKLLEFLKTRRKIKETGDKSKTKKAKDVSFSVHKEIKKIKRAAHESSVPASSCVPAISSSSTWVNMDTVEADKLEWMKDLPQPTSASGNTARFDFSGNLMCVDADVPVNVGLHHHGLEPERAGYSLEELFQLARSSNLQQRCLALHTLARIIRKARLGEFGQQIATPITPGILAGGVIMLLRWAMDDVAEPVVVAAVDALTALVCLDADKRAVDHTWTWYLGHVSPSLTPTATLLKRSEEAEKGGEVDEENKEEETDADVSKRDIIEVLVQRMDILTRIRYILSTMRPQAVTVAQLMDLLARIARHSCGMAYEVARCRELMDLIFAEFLPTAWDLQVNTSGLVSHVYGLPVPQAVRLVRCLCQSGRNMAASLCARYTLHLRILRYLASSYKDLQLPTQEAFSLQVEALSLWRVTAAYGLTTDTFFDLYNNILPRVGSLTASWQRSTNEVTGVKGHDEGHKSQLDAGLVCVLEQMVNIAGNVSVKGQGGPRSSSDISAPRMTLSEVSSLQPLVTSCVAAMLEDIGQHYTAKRYDLQLPISCLNFLSTYYSVEGRQIGQDNIERLDQLQLLTTASLVPFLASYGFNTLCEKLSFYSNILNSDLCLSSETSISLPDLSAVVEIKGHMDGDDLRKSINEPEGHMAPVVGQNSPFGFLTSVLRLCLCVCQRHKALIPQLMIPLVQHKGIEAYMLTVVRRGTDQALSQTHLTRWENILHYLWLKCCCLQPTHISSPLPHQVSLHLLGRLHSGDEHLAHDLMSSVMFSTSFFSTHSDVQHLSPAIADMAIVDHTLCLSSATQEDISLSRGKLIEAALNNLNTIRGHFLMAFGGMEKDVQDSRSVISGRCQEINSLLCGHVTDVLLPKDWSYLPLLHVYNTVNQGSKGSVSGRDTSIVTSVLQWNFLCEELRPREVEAVSVTVRLSRLLCVFMAGNDLFLEPCIHHYLAALLRVFTQPKYLSELDFEETIPGCTSFYDLYQDVLSQFEAVSFGDPVFSLYVMLCLQQKHSSMLRKAVWGERRKMLRTLRIPLHEMLIPIENFLSHDEDDTELIQLYMQALINKDVQWCWSPCMYLTAVHHVNHFLYVTQDDGHEQLRSTLWRRLLSCMDQNCDVVMYKNLNVSQPRGMETYECLPHRRQATLDLHLHRLQNKDHS